MFTFPITMMSSDGSYTIENAIWLDGSADYLTRTPSSAGNQQIWTLSWWQKKTWTGVSSPGFWGVGDLNFSSGNANDWIFYDNGDHINIQLSDASSGTDANMTSALDDRDPTAWAHWIVAVNTTLSTASERVRVYRNGTEITDFGSPTDPGTSINCRTNGTDQHVIGGGVTNSSNWWSGYLAEIIMVDGAQEVPADFGELDDNDVWRPIDCSGLTFGTNGFHLNFSDANALGLDVSRGATHPGTVDLQISFDGDDADTSTTDESSNSHTVTFVGDAELDTAQYKFSPSSLLLDGTGDYVKCADNADWRLGGGTGDFTLEFFARLASGVTAAVMVGQEQNATTDFWAVYWNNSAGLQFINRTGNTNTIYFAQGSNSLSVETWYHIALVRSGSVFTFYVNGSSVATASDASPITDFSGELRIGHNTGSGAIGVAAFNGHVDEFRLINGGAVYNGNFTALTAAFGAPENKTNNSFTQVSIAQSQQVADSPTDDADNNIGNYATFNSIDRHGSTTLANGNLHANGTTTHEAQIRTTIALTGKKYWEIEADTLNADAAFIGILKTNTDITTMNNHSLGTTADGYSINCSTGSNNGKLYNNSTNGTDLGTIANGDIISVAFDADTRKLFFGKNGSWLGSADPANGTNPAYTASVGTYTAAVSVYTTSSLFKANFGQTAFSYTVPTGFDAGINTADLPAPTVTDPSAYFFAKTYTGNSDSENPRNVTGFQDGGGNNITPDLVWIKSTSDGYSNTVWDSVRGFGNGTELLTDANSEIGSQAGGNGNVSGVVAGGFTATESGSDSVYVNEQGKDYVAWMWKAGGAPTADNSAGQTPTNNSVFRNGSASTTAFASANIYPTRASIGAGLSILKYTGNGDSDQTLATGLTGAAHFALIKRHTAGGDWAAVWIVGSTLYSGEFNNSTNEAAVSDQVKAFGSGTITIDGGSANDEVAYSAFIFQNTTGLIDTGTFIGNNSASGPVVHTGFEPAFLLVRRMDSGNGDWYISDGGRNPYNPVTHFLRANDAGAQDSFGTASHFQVDYLSNGFRPVATNGSDWNGSGVNFCYLAIAGQAGDPGTSQARAR